MEHLVKTTGHDLWFEEIFSPDEFVSPFGDDDYVLLLVNDRTDVPDPEQKNLSERLIATGCRYPCSFGFECSSWDDPIDYPYIFSDRNLDPPNDRFVMTTGYEGETIEEVATIYAGTRYSMILSRPDFQFCFWESTTPSR